MTKSGCQRESFELIEVGIDLLFGFEGSDPEGAGSPRRGREPNRSGDNDGEDPPVPMPNTVVKLSDADDSQLATARENMSLPDTKGKPAR